MICIDGTANIHPTNIHLSSGIQDIRLIDDANMPKSKELQREFNLRIIKTYTKIVRADNSILYCVLCDSTIAAKQLSQIKQHLDCAKHKATEERNKL